MDMQELHDRGLKLRRELFGAAAVEQRASALGEFTAIKGVDVTWKTGWLSDRAAAFLATGRPVITEDSGASRYLPPASGFHFVGDLDSTVAAVEDVLAHWRRRSREARECAVEIFDAAKNLQKILDV